MSFCLAVHFCQQTSLRTTLHPLNSTLPRSKVHLQNCQRKDSFSWRHAFWRLGDPVAMLWLYRGKPRLRGAVQNPLEAMHCVWSHVQSSSVPFRALG